MNWFNNPWDTDSLPGQENPNAPANQPPSRPVEGQGQRNDNPYGGAFAMVGAMLATAASLERNRRRRTDYRSGTLGLQPQSPIPLPPISQPGGSPQPLAAQYLRHKWEREWEMGKTNESAESGLGESPQQEEGGIVNPYKELAEKTKDKDLKNEYLRLHAQTDQLLQTFKENDPELYNYINSLKIKDKDGKETQLQVVVVLNDTPEKRFESDRPYNGRTKFKPKPTSDNKYKYKGNPIRLYETTLTVPWPSGFDGGQTKKPEPVLGTIQGFQVNIWNLTNKQAMNDALANEAGDIMFAMEFPNSVDNSNNVDAKGNLSGNYKNTASQNYSSNVEYVYKRRKDGTLAKDFKAYPLPSSALMSEKRFKEDFERKYPLPPK